ncbi:hypothetical protein QBC32DRAFT_98423 [Pseudoneurospora amorphoporcata]|uniref:Uncharacterized protein n=1 Tax=Pseudoneurospora amorphoporcata TaxID=241081 RepID=A0AAN6NJS6_9PEZI|nr:hypothetical protein QBC32DRAFT_98423 [Pseudoneurospora amorphoporcata]
MILCRFEGPEKPYHQQQFNMNIAQLVTLSQWAAQCMNQLDEARSLLEDHCKTQAAATTETETWKDLQNHMSTFPDNFWSKRNNWLEETVISLGFSPPPLDPVPFPWAVLGSTTIPGPSNSVPLLTFPGFVPTGTVPGSVPPGTFPGSVPLSATFSGSTTGSGVSNAGPPPVAFSGRVNDLGLSGPILGLSASGPIIGSSPSGSAPPSRTLFGSVPPGTISGSVPSGTFPGSVAGSRPSTSRSKTFSGLIPGSGPSTSVPPPKTFSGSTGSGPLSPIPPRRTPSGSISRARTFSGAMIASSGLSNPLPPSGTISSSNTISNLAPSVPPPGTLSNPTPGGDPSRHQPRRRNSSQSHQAARHHPYSRENRPPAPSQMSQNQQTETVNPSQPLQNTGQHMMLQQNPQMGQQMTGSGPSSSVPPPGTVTGSAPPPGMFLGSMAGSGISNPVPPSIINSGPMAGSGVLHAAPPPAGTLSDSTFGPGPSNSVPTSGTFSGSGPPLQESSGYVPQQQQQTLDLQTFSSYIGDMQQQVLDAFSGSAPPNTFLNSAPPLQTSSDPTAGLNPSGSDPMTGVNLSGSVPPGTLSNSAFPVETFSDPIMTGLDSMDSDGNILDDPMAALEFPNFPDSMPDSSS